MDIVSDLSTLFCGFNPKRVFNGYVFLGAGLNRGFDNDEAVAIDAAGYKMDYLWTEGKFLVAGRMGLGCNLRLNDHCPLTSKVMPMFCPTNSTQRKRAMPTGSSMLSLV